MRNFASINLNRVAWNILISPAWPGPGLKDDYWSNLVRISDIGLKCDAQYSTMMQISASNIYLRGICGGSIELF